MRYSPEEVENLREQVIISNFVHAVGCHYDEARGYLVKSKWQYQRALSQFFQEAVIEPRTDDGGFEGISGRQDGRPFSTPTNTPNTPPDFPEALLQSFTLHSPRNQEAMSNQNESQIHNSQHYCFEDPPIINNHFTPNDVIMNTTNFTASHLGREEGVSEIFEMDM